jgi:lysophospholipase L1-like esterase
MPGGRLLVTLAGLLATALLAGCSGSAADPATDPRPSSPASDLPDLRYVALGDSFTAAPGLAETDRSDGCLRSTGNYPSLVAAGLSDSYDVALTDRSCIGADTTDLATGQESGQQTLAPQLDALSRRTDLVTLSMGGNDFSLFLQLVAGCLSVVAQDPDGSPCRDNSEVQGDPWRDALPRIEDRLVEAVRDVVRRAPRAEVLLVGYPQLAPAEGSCAERLPLAEGDLPFAREVNKGLTDTLRDAARRTGSTYVDVWAASAGHDICAEEPWTNGQQSGPSGAIPFHPLPAGQAAVAGLVLDEVGG